uniref:Uncharacterized protein n=1 Tax=Romanomermis culicivorax TaxID=13658 RepID=A0A915JDC9_ROMCU
MLGLLSTELTVGVEVADRREPVGLIKNLMPDSAGIYTTVTDNNSVGHCGIDGFVSCTPTGPTLLEVIGTVSAGH